MEKKLNNSLNGWSNFEEYKKELCSLLEKYDLYQNKKKEVNDLFVEIREEAKDLEIDAFISLKYEELKRIDETVARFLPQETLEKFWKLRDTRKKEKYPQLLKATYYPILNELVGKASIGQDEINYLDALLRNYYRKDSDASFSQHRLNEIFRDEDKLNCVIKFLLDRNMVEREYLFESKCDGAYCCTPTRVKESTMKRHIVVWEFEEKTKGLKSSEIPKIEGYDEYNEAENNGIGVIIVGCFCCEGYEITSIEEFENSIYTIGCILKVAPDLTYENL